MFIIFKKVTIDVFFLVVVRLEVGLVELGLQCCIVYSEISAATLPVLSVFAGFFR